MDEDADDDDVASKVSSRRFCAAGRPSVLDNLLLSLGLFRLKRPILSLERDLPVDNNLSLRSFFKSVSRADRNRRLTKTRKYNSNNITFYTVVFCGFINEGVGARVASAHVAARSLPIEYQRAEVAEKAELHAAKSRVPNLTKPDRRDTGTIV